MCAYVCVYVWEDLEGACSGLFEGTMPAITALHVTLLALYL